MSSASFPAPADVSVSAGMPDWPVRGREGPPLLLLTENRGVSPYMEDVAQALVEHGFRVVTPDLLWRLGGTAAHREDPTAVSTRDVPQATQVSDVVKSYDRMCETIGESGVIGFCFGAEMGWELLARRDAPAAVLHYGISPDPAGVARRSTPIYAAYAQDDDRVNRTLPDLIAALSDGAAEHILESFPGTRHAFHDHRRPSRHHPSAADELWRRTLAFLAARLSSGG